MNIEKVFAGTAMRARHRGGGIAVPGLVFALGLAVAYAATPVVDGSKLPPAATGAVDFVRDIQPLFAAHCVKCHGPEKQKGELRLDVKDAALKGGDSGKVIVPGKSAESRLVHRIAGLDEQEIMPPKGGRLTAGQVGLVRAWIEQGANWPEAGAGARVRRSHWSLQPLRLPVVPKLDGAVSQFPNAMDAFVTARLATDAFALKVWHLKRSKEYGSEHYDEHPLAIAAAKLSADARTVTLDIPTLAPTQCYELTTKLPALGGTAINRSIHGTIHRLFDK